MSGVLSRKQDAKLHFSHTRPELPLRLNRCFGPTEIWAASFPPRTQREKKNKTKNSEVLEQKQRIPIRLSSSNKHPHMLSTLVSTGHVCLTSLCIESFIMFTHAAQPPQQLLVYSVHHVVSCLLMDSHWSNTCNSQLTDCCSTGAAAKDSTYLLYRPLSESLSRCCLSFFWGTIVTCTCTRTGNYVCYVVLGLKRRTSNDEFARFNRQRQKIVGCSERSFGNKSKIKSHEKLGFTALIYAETFV